MIFSKRNSTPPDDPNADKLASLVKQQLGDADDDTVRIVTAVAGLLACVAYADHDYSESERNQVRSELERVQGLSSAGVNAICTLMEQNIVLIARGNTHAYTRDLRSLTDLEMRREVLQVLVDLAAVDGSLELSETDLLRRVTGAMGLTPGDFNLAQGQYRDRLSVLK